MFFDPNTVNTLLDCRNCGGRLDEPKLLLCGNSICTVCASSIQVTNNEFQCLVCNDKHDMPKNGLPLNNALKELLSCTPTNVSRGRAFDELQEPLKDLLNKTKLIY